MKQAAIYKNNSFAGILTQYHSGNYTFEYDSVYLKDASKVAISLTMPKRENPYTSSYLFPFFFNMLSEGVNRTLQSKQLRIDEKDYFGLLLETATIDTIGSVTVRKLEQI